MHLVGREYTRGPGILTVPAPLQMQRVQIECDLYGFLPRPTDSLNASDAGNFTGPQNNRGTPRKRLSSVRALSPYKTWMFCLKTNGAL